MRAAQLRTTTKRSWPGRKLKALVFLGLAVMLALILGALVRHPSIEARIKPSEIKHEIGFAYYAPILVKLQFPYMLAGDSPQAPAQSRLSVYRDGKVIGPAHSIHQKIRTLGRGAYSHWFNGIYFSTPQNVDPRTDGAVYTIQAQLDLQPRIRIGLLILAAAAAVGLIAIDRRLSARIASAAIVMGMALAALGAFGRLKSSFGFTEDPALILAVFWHSMLGVAITLLQWLAGTGLAWLLWPEGRSQPPALALLGYVVSLPLLAIVAAVGLLVPSGFLIGVTVLISLSMVLLAKPEAKAEIRSLAPLATPLVLLALTFGLWMGVHLHGPTDTVPGAISGDIVTYGGSIWNIDSQPWPLRNLGVAGEMRGGYINHLWASIGALLLHRVPLDAFLFITSAGASAFVIGLGLSLFFYVRASCVAGINLASGLILFFSLVVSCGYYPTWIAESVPVIHAIPLVVASFYFIAVRSGDRIRILFSSIPLVVIGSALSKVTLAATLLPLAALKLLPKVPTLHTWWRLLIALTVVAIAVYVFYVFQIARAALPVYTDTFGPDSYHYVYTYHAPLSVAWPFYLRDAGTLLLAGLCFFRFAPRIAIPVALGLAAGLLFPFLFRIAAVAGFLCFGLSAVLPHCYHNAEKYDWVTLFALFLIVPASVFTDWTGNDTGLIWLIIVAMLTTVILAFELGERNPFGVTRVSTSRAALLIFTTACLAAVAVARGFVSVSWRSPLDPQLTPSALDIWRSVRESTPRNALIFTDQVSNEMTLLGGWNTFCWIGQRQVFVASIFQSKLRYETAAREAKLKANEAVLSGHANPRDMIKGATFSSFYAVVSKKHIIPQDWVKLRTNHDFALYRIIAK